jgi:hypothetical protein
VGIADPGHDASMDDRPTRHLWIGVNAVLWLLVAAAAVVAFAAMTH